MTGATSWNETDKAHAEYLESREQKVAVVVAACEDAVVTVLSPGTRIWGSTHGPRPSPSLACHNTRSRIHGFDFYVISRIFFRILLVAVTLAGYLVIPGAPRRRACALAAVLSATGLMSMCRLGRNW